MTTEASPSYLDAPQANQAYALLQRAAQNSLEGVVGQPVTATVQGRRATSVHDVAQSTKNVLIELQFERPAEVHHSVAVLSDGNDLIQMFALAGPDAGGEILGAESLLSLGDIVSTILDTLTSELTWLTPTARAWLANLEPVAADTDGTTHVELPAMVAKESPLYLADVSLASSSGAVCALQLVFSEQTEQALLGMDSPDDASTLHDAAANDWIPAMDASIGGAPPDGIPAAAMPRTPVQAVQFKPLGPDQQAGRSNSIELIKDVPLHISVELGRASLTVREILALGVGSVVELDRLAGEPVDVLVNDRLIGRGEVVIVDESFGVRLTEVLRESSRRAAQ